MIFVTWNINGLRSYNKKYNLKEFIEKYNIDVLNLQETRLVDGWDWKQEIQLNDSWNIYQNLATSRKGYAGVATISKVCMNPLKLDISNQRFQAEGRMLMFKYGDYILINIYFPQGDRTKKDIPYKLEVCDYIINMIKFEFGKWIVTGDFNMAQQELDLAHPKQNLKNNMFTIEERAKLVEFSQAGLVDTYREMHPNGQNYTWWPYAYNARERNMGWRIDYIWVSDSLKSCIKRVDILSDVLGSDHCPVLMELDV